MEVNYIVLLKVLFLMIATFVVNGTGMGKGI